MTDRYTSFEATAAGYTTDTHTFTAARHDIDVVSEELTPERNNIYAVTSKGRTPRRKLQGPLAWTGNIETLLYTTQAPTLIYYAMGGNSFALDTPQTGVNTHSVTQANTIPHFIMEVGRDDVGHKYTGCVATGFTVDYTPDTAVTLNVDVNARKEQASGSLASVTLDDFDSAERAYGGTEIITQFGAAEGGSPSSEAVVESANITYDNNFEDSAYVLGDQHLSGNFVNQINLSGSIEVSFIDSTKYFEVTSDTEKELWLVANNGLTLTAERGYTFKLPRISYDTTTLATNNAERYVQTIDFTANDNATGNNMIVEIINSEAEADFTA